MVNTLDLTLMTLTLGHGSRVEYWQECQDQELVGVLLPLNAVQNLTKVEEIELALLVQLAELTLVVQNVDLGVEMVLLTEEIFLA